LFSYTTAVSSEDLPGFQMRDGMYCCAQAHLSAIAEYCGFLRVPETKVSFQVVLSQSDRGYFFRVLQHCNRKMSF
jgi:hypothetical protein